MEKFRLRNMKVTRVDLVDRGANQDAHIVLTKRDTALDERHTKLIEKMSAPKPGAKKPAAPGGAPAPKVEPTPIARPKGTQQRIVRIRPEDFEVTSLDNNMMEWAIPEDKLPEGVEEAIMTMAQSGDTVMFQWMIDPLAGPPVEGQAKTAAEAFMAMRAALTNTGAMDPMSMLGGLPGQKPPPPEMPQMAPPKKLSKAIEAVRKARAETPATPKEDPAVVRKNVEATLDATLDLIVKGLVEVDVFNETATGADLRDILPGNLLEDITNQLSATQSAE